MKMRRLVFALPIAMVLVACTQVGEIQGLLKKLPPPLNAEYLPIPVDATTLVRVWMRVRARVSDPYP